MSLTAAARRYTRRFLLMMVAYGVLLTGATWIAKTFDLDGAALIALSILSTLPIAGGLAVMGLYLIEETDEYVRQRTAMGMLFSVGVLLSISTALGFLQQHEFIAGVDLLWAFPIWCVVASVAQCWIMWRDSRGVPEA